MFSYFEQKFHWNIPLEKVFFFFFFFFFCQVLMTYDENRLLGRHFETIHHFIFSWIIVFDSAYIYGAKVFFLGGSMEPPPTPTGVKVPRSPNAAVNGPPWAHPPQGSSNFRRRLDVESWDLSISGLWIYESYFWTWWIFT